MSLPLRSAIAIPLALALAGCTINTYSAPPPAAQARPTQPAQPAPAPRTPRRPAQPAQPAKPAPTAQPTRPTQPSQPALAPRITAPIAFGNGKGGAFRGQIYVIPVGSEKLPNLATLVPFGTLYTDQLNIGSQEFTGGFPGLLAQDQWFAIRYEGNFSIPNEGGWTFKLISDDGAVLHIDGAKVIDNDGVHEATEKTASRVLKPGTHRLTLDYFQGAGKVALQLFIKGLGGKDTLLQGSP
jgi:hypothetical protein